MNKYRLVGFVSPDAQASSFLIPVFSTSNSNYSFAQELDDEFNIVEFLLFNPTEYEKVDVAVPYLELSVGGSGCIAFTNQNGAVFSGTHSEIVHVLENEDLSDYSPFIKMEIYTFLKNEKLYKENCLITKMMFGNESSRRIWDSSNLEKFLRIKTKKSKSIYNSIDQEVADLVEHLIEIFDDHKWHAYWKPAWEKFQGNKKLLKVALSWLDTRDRPAYSIDQVVISLLKANVINHTIDKYAEDWLVSNDVTEKTWPTIWVLLNSDKIHSELCFTIGISFLEAQITGIESINKKGIYNWSKIWSIIYKEKRHNIYLLRLAKSVAKNFEISEDFNRFVILTILENNKEELWAKENALRWLKHHRFPEILWIKMFIQVQYLSSNNQVREIMKDWLYDVHVNKNWFRLWNLKKKIFSDQDRAIILRKSLSKNFRQGSLWAALMTDLIGNNYSNLQDRENAYRWMKENEGLSYTRNFMLLKNILAPLSKVSSHESTA